MEFERPEGSVVLDDKALADFALALQKPMGLAERRLGLVDGLRERGSAVEGQPRRIEADLVHHVISRVTEDDQIEGVVEVFVVVRPFGLDHLTMRAEQRAHSR